MTATDVLADSHVILKTVSGAPYAQTETLVTLSTSFEVGAISETFTDETGVDITM